MIPTKKWITGIAIGAVVSIAAATWLVTEIVKEARRAEAREQGSRIFLAMTAQCQREKEIDEEEMFRKMASEPEKIADRRMLNWKACQCKSHHVLDKASGALSDEVIKGLFFDCVDRAVKRQWD